MQVSATLIAAQQAARRSPGPVAGPAGASQQANFAAALEKTTGFSALPLKQVAPPAAPAAQPQTTAPARMGQHIDITV